MSDQKCVPWSGPFKATQASTALWYVIDGTETPILPMTSKRKAEYLANALNSAPTQAARIEKLEEEVKLLDKALAAAMDQVKDLNAADITLRAQVERLRGLLEGVGKYIYTTMPSGKDLQGQRNLLINSIRSALAETGKEKS